MYPVTQDFIEKMRTKTEKRHVIAKAVIDYTDPFIDQSITIEANEQANVSYPQQTADSLDQSTLKYACLDGTWDLTTGEYHLAPSANMLTRYQMGWWGAQFADQNGYFSQPYPTLTIRHLPRPIHSLRVVGDIAREEWPVDFQIKLYGPDDTLLKTETITDNDQISWSKTLDPEVLDVAKQELIITRWSLPGTCAKIIEFFTSIREVYETGDLVSIRLLEEREVSQGSLPVGNISSNEIRLALNNEDKKFDIDNDQSPLKNLLKPNRRIQVWLGTEAENVTTENPPTFTRASVAYLSNGRQVLANTPRFEAGKFGKAIMVEEGTVNLFTNPRLLNNGSGWIPNSATAWVDSSGGYPYIHCEKQWDGVYQTLSLSAATYTLTYLVKHKAGSNTIGSHFDESPSRKIRVDRGTWVYSDLITVPSDGNWHLVEIQATYTTAGSYRVYLQPGRGVTEVSEFYFKYAQIEQKPYATSFTDGTRAAETLTIPTAWVLNPQEGTVECWVYIDDRFINGMAGKYAWIWGTKGSPYYPILNLYRHGFYNTLRFVSRDANNNQSYIEKPLSQISVGWHYIACTWKSSRLAFFLDGQIVGEVVNPYLPNTVDAQMYIGHNPSVGEQCNLLIDDLRISNKARSDEEILAAYQNNVPQPVDEWTTYKLSFDGHLYRSTLGPAWIPLGTFWSLDWDSPDDSLEATVTARDRMELLRKSTFQTSQVLTNKSLYELAEIVLQDAGLMPEEYIIDPALQNIVVPYSWFNPVSHREALRRIAEAGLAVAYADRDGKIRIESFLLGDDESALEITEDDYFPPLRAPSRQEQVANEIIVDTQPLRPAEAPTEVYKSNEPITIPANSTKTIMAYYNQPPVIEAVASLVNPPTRVSIIEATYYGWGASVTIQNSNTTDQQITLVINGKPLTVQNKERAIARDETSIIENGVLRYEFPANPLIQTLSQAQAIADALLTSVKDSRRDIEVEWRGNPALLLGDRVTVKGKDYHVIRQEINWQGYLEARLTGRRAT